jgi:uncharacterized Zn finger protein (UPF0148 family)
MHSSCFQCGKPGSQFHGYIICETCKKRLRLFSKETIHQHLDSFQEAGKSYAQKIQQQLNAVEKKYIKAKLKLLDIQETLKNL